MSGRTLAEIAAEHAAAVPSAPGVKVLDGGATGTGLRRPTPDLRRGDDPDDPTLDYIRALARREGPASIRMLSYLRDHGDSDRVRLEAGKALLSKAGLTDVVAGDAATMGAMAGGFLAVLLETERLAREREASGRVIEGKVVE